MKLALVLVLVVNLQLINAFGFIVPLFDRMIADSVPTFGYENQGLDQNGNPYYEKQIIQASFRPMSQDDFPVNTEFSDYFQQDDTDGFEQGYNTDKFDLSLPHTQKESINFPAGNLDQWKFGSKMENIEIPAGQFPMPGLGPFHLRQEKYESGEKKSIVDGTSKYQFILENSQKQAKPIETKTEVSMSHSLEDSGEESENLINFEKNVETKERDFLTELTGQKSPLFNYNDLTSMYFQMDKKLTQNEAEDLLKYIAELAGFPYEWIKDIRINENIVSFKVDQIDLDVLCSIIEDNHQVVDAKKGYKILSCSRGNIEARGLKQSLNSNKTLFIITIVVCVTVLTTLIVLLSLFIVRRKAYLRQKLIENVSSIKKKNEFDDVEQLVNDESPNKQTFIQKVWPFKTKQVNVQQADLCRSSKLNADGSPLNNTTQTDLSSRCDNFESTPITVDERKESTRSSASS